MYVIGDKVQAHDGRIGVVIEVEELCQASTLPSSQQIQIVVKLLDGSQIQGIAEDFKAVYDKPFAKVGQRQY